MLLKVHLGTVVVSESQRMRLMGWLWVIVAVGTGHWKREHRQVMFHWRGRAAVLGLPAWSQNFWQTSCSKRRLSFIIAVWDDAVLFSIWQLQTLSGVPPGHSWDGRKCCHLINQQPVLSTCRSQLLVAKWSMPLAQSCLLGDFPVQNSHSQIESVCGFLRIPSVCGFVFDFLD